MMCAIQPNKKGVEIFLFSRIRGLIAVDKYECCCCCWIEDHAWCRGLNEGLNADSVDVWMEELAWREKLS